MYEQLPKTQPLPAKAAVLDMEMEVDADGHTKSLKLLEEVQEQLV